MSEGIDLRDDDRGEFSAFVFIPLFHGDVGKSHSRGQRTEFTDRKPAGVNLQIEGASVTVRNSGVVASDVITLDWRVRFCTFEDHKPHEGFTVDHAGEGQSPIENFDRLQFLEGGGHFTFEIQFPEPPAGLRNIYFQARVHTLWSGAVPVDDWASRFETDPQITEAHIPVIT